VRRCYLRPDEVRSFLKRIVGSAAASRPIARGFLRSRRTHRRAAQAGLQAKPSGNSSAIPGYQPIADHFKQQKYRYGEHCRGKQGPGKILEKDVVDGEGSRIHPSRFRNNLKLSGALVIRESPGFQSVFRNVLIGNNEKNIPMIPLFHSLGKAAADAAVSIEQHHRRVWNLDVIHSCRSRPSKHPFFWYFRTAGQFFEPLCQAREFVLRHLFWRRLRPILKAYVVAAPTLTFWRWQLTGPTADLKSRA